MLSTQQREKKEPLYPKKALPSAPSRENLTEYGETSADEKKSQPLPLINLESIVIQSSLNDEDPSQLINNIVQDFNRGNKEDFTVQSNFFGTRIDANQFMLVHRNNTPQLVAPSNKKIRLGVYATGITEVIKVYNQTELCIGAHGRYVINVPQGTIVKAWLGKNKPIFLGEGPHVIRHPNFELDQNPIVRLSEEFISHGNYRIVRVPKGKFAKIWLGTIPYLLESSPYPYIFNDPTFSIMYRTINLGDGKTKSEYFTDATERLIVHGSIKRILPKKGREVAICYENGTTLKIIGDLKQAFVVDSETFSVDGFLEVHRQQFIFPSPETKEERRKINPNDQNAINYEMFSTSDGYSIGVNLLAVYEIENPQALLEKFHQKDIKKHIENVVVAHMSSVILSCTSADFQKSTQHSLKEKERQSSADDLVDIFQMPSVPSPFYAQLHEDTNKLVQDLLKIGIRLTQLRMEPPKVLDPQIAAEMAKNALINAKARAEVSVLDLNFKIKQQEAAQRAEQARIDQDREKAYQILKAEAEAESTTLKARGELEAAKLRAEAYRVENEAQLRIMEAKAKMFDEHKGLLDLEMTRVQAEAMRSIHSVVSPEVAAAWFTTPGVGLFAGMRNPTRQLVAIENDSSPKVTPVQFAKTS